MAAPLPPEARELDAAKRRGRVRNQPRVDADHADLQRLGDAVAALDVAAEEVAGEADVGRVGELDDLALGIEGEEGGDGAERLLGRDLHLGRGAADDGRGVEVGAEVRQLVAADEDVAAVVDGVPDVRGDLGDGAVVDERAVGDGRVVAAADLEALDLVDEGGGEGVVDAALDVDAVGADAGLARGAEFAGDGAGDGSGQVGVVEDDEGRVAAELEGEFLQCVGGLLHEELPDAGAAREGHFSNRHAARQRLADFGCVLEGCDDVDHALGDACTMGKLG